MPAAVAALILPACGGNNASSESLSMPPMGAPRHATSSGKIQHVVVVIQENRSLNNLFYGFHGATTAKYGYDSRGNQVEIKPLPLEAPGYADHYSWSFFTACNGTGSIPGTNCRMNGFNKERVTDCQGKAERCRRNYFPYSYVPHSETKPYFELGYQYVLADQMFSSNFDSSSFVAHQYLISAQAESSVNYPKLGEWGCPGGPNDTIAMVGPQRQIPDGHEVVCWDPTTLGDELDNAAITWGYYTATVKGDGNEWNAYQAINHIYNGKDWTKDVITPQTQFFKDVSSGNLRAVSWITPTWANSDHPHSLSKTGPSWVASIVNAIGESQYWDSTVVFVLWDDYGGWYDSVAPTYVDYDGLGFRVPLLVLSAYAKKSHVSHVAYEFGSVLKFIEDVFGLPPMSASDARANSPAQDCFDFTKPPRTFVPIQSPYDARYFERQPLDLHPLDEY
ncbi:MAG: hypothetical protein JO113_03760 [Candidatus Eremiobacteraeota bacterium]|nr:hypothetical protein [Candidatus Eremiobacteraeota bacterium]